MYSVVLMMAVSGGAEIPDFHRRRCHRCHGCSYCWGCYGCQGCHGYYRCHGCYGCCRGVILMPQRPKEKIPPPKKKTEDQVQTRTPALVLVTLPAESRLLVSDQVTTITAGERRFQTPPLEPGRDYFYLMRAEIKRGGRTVALTRRVTVRAGEESRVSFAFSSPEIALSN